MTIDVLLSHPTEADALANPALAPWRAGEGWNLGTVFPNLTLVITPAAYDENGVETQAQVNFPGWWMLISVPGDTPPEALTSIEPCRMVAHREWGAAGLPFVFQQGLRAAPEQIASITRIDGLPAGSAYPLSEVRVIP